MPRSRQPQYVQGRLEGVDWDSPHYRGSYRFGSSQPKDSYTPALPDHPDRVRGFHVTPSDNVASIKRTGLRPSTYSPEQVKDMTGVTRAYNRNGVYFSRDEPETEYGDAIMEMSAHKSRVKEDRETGYELATHGIPPQHVAQVGHIYKGIGGVSRTHWSTAPAESCIDCNKSHHHEVEAGRKRQAAKQALDPNNTGV
jgi:hypothetical protein